MLRNRLRFWMKTPYISKALVDKPPQNPVAYDNPVGSSGRFFRSWLCSLVCLWSAAGWMVGDALTCGALSVPFVPILLPRLLQARSQDPEETARLDPALPSAFPPDLPKTPGRPSFKGPREGLQFFTGRDAKSNPQGEKIRQGMTMGR